MSVTLLAVDGLVAGYGDSIILEGVSIELAARGSLALLGREARPPLLCGRGHYGYAGVDPVAVFFRAQLREQLKSRIDTQAPM